MRVIQVNSVYNTGSTGRIVKNIYDTATEQGIECYVGASRVHGIRGDKIIKIGNEIDRNLHGLKTRLLDRHGFGSLIPTLKFIKQIKNISPDIIHIHNLHGYYLNIEYFFEYLHQFNGRIIWTFHDCWPFTGHCSNYERVGCFKWIEGCFDCPLIKGYPASWGIDNSRENYLDKKRLFSGLKDLRIVTPSTWLSENVKKSFLKEYPVITIPNGIDLEVFKPRDYSSVIEKNNLKGKKIILGVANTWKGRKAYDDFQSLGGIIGNDKVIILIGKMSGDGKKPSSKIKFIPRTENAIELAKYYSAADVFINPTYADNLPTTNIEALACGTPVITYLTGGSPETIDEETGICVKTGNIDALKNAITYILEKGKSFYSLKCRERALKNYCQTNRANAYFDLYRNVSN